MTCTHYYLYLLIIYFSQHWVFVATCRLSLVPENRGYFLVALYRLLTAAASLVQHRL